MDIETGPDKIVLFRAHSAEHLENELREKWASLSGWWHAKSRAERLGHMMIGASAVLIALMIFMYFHTR